MGSRAQVTAPPHHIPPAAGSERGARLQSAPTALTAACLCFSSRSTPGGLCPRCLQACALGRSVILAAPAVPLPGDSPSQPALPAALCPAAPRPELPAPPRLLFPLALCCPGSCLLLCPLLQQRATPTGLLLINCRGRKNVGRFLFSFFFQFKFEQ